MSESEPYLNSRFDIAPISKLIGMDVEPGGAGEATIHLKIEEHFHNPMGQVHGGVLSLLADACMGIAFGRTLNDNQSFATVDLHIQFMRPVAQGRLTAKASIRQRGLRIGFVECSIEDHRQRLIATARCTCNVVS